MSIPRTIALITGTILLGVLTFLQPLRFINNLFYDLSFRFSSTPASDSVAIVAIDDRSIEKIGAMPWSRGTLSKIIDSINAAGAKAISLDILFPRRPDSAQNDSLSAAFSRVSRLVLPFKIGHLTGTADTDSRLVPRDVYKCRFLRITSQDKLVPADYFSGSDISASDTLFTRFAPYGGFLNVSTSMSSQKLREIIHVIRVGNEYYPSLAIASVAAWRGLGPGEMALDGNGSVTLGPLKCPITPYAGTSFINYRKGGFCTVSAADLLNGVADRSLLRGKLVFVGVTDPSAAADFFLSPISPQYPGVLVWATVALDIIQSSWIRHGGGIGGLGNALLLLLLFPGCALIIPSYRRLLSIGAGTGIVAISVILSIAVFKSYHYFWDPTGHLYGWIMLLLWLAASKAVPSLASLPPLVLEPAESIDENVPLPPKELDFKERLPRTATLQFVSKTHNRRGGTGPLPSETSAAAPAETVSGTGIDGGAGTQSSTTAVEDIDAKALEIAGGVILRSIGSGGMADVFLVWNPRLEVYRAVKIMKPGQSGSFLSRFETEIRIFAKLHHANIVECYSVGDWHTLPYIEMEYINGLAMDNVLRQCDRLTVVQSLSIGVLVSRALHYAHNQTIHVFGKKYKGIVHRDLKPANIMLCRNGRVKLTDFGIARPGELARDTSDTGHIVGTFPYLAPEQIDGSDLTGQADVYALGATLYEFITGERAFPQTDANAIMAAKMTGAYKPISPSGAVSKEVIAMIGKAMATNPSDRHASAAALRSDLERVLRPLVARSDGFIHLKALAECTMRKSVAGTPGNTV